MTDIIPVLSIIVPALILLVSSLHYYRDYIAKKRSKLVIESRENMDHSIIDTDTGYLQLLVRNEGSRDGILSFHGVDVFGYNNEWDHVNAEGPGPIWVIFNPSNLPDGNRIRPGDNIPMSMKVEIEEPALLEDYEKLRFELQFSVEDNEGSYDETITVQTDAEIESHSEGTGEN